MRSLNTTPTTLFYYLVIAICVFFSCSSSLPSRTQNQFRPLTQGESVYLARYNPCACGLGETQFSVELSQIAQEDLEELKAQRLTQGSIPMSTISIPLSIVRNDQKTPQKEDQEIIINDQSLSLRLSQSAVVAAKIQQNPRQDLSTQRSWERIEVTSAHPLNRAPNPPRKDPTAPASKFSPTKNTIEVPTEVNTLDRLDEDTLKQISLWRNLWLWWPQNPDAYLLLRINLKDYSRGLTGHILHRGELLDIEVILDP